MKIEALDAPLTDVRDMLRDRKPAEEESTAWHRGSIKWFDPTRRYGWIIPEEDYAKDVFLPWTILRECDIKESEAREGVRVVYKWSPPKRPGDKRTVTQIRMVIRR